MRMKRLVVLALLGLATSAAGFAQMRGMSAPSRPMARPPMAFAHPRFGGIRPNVSARPMTFAPRPGFRLSPGFAGRRPIFLARPGSRLRTSSFGRRVIVMPRPNHGRVASVRPRLPGRDSRSFLRGHHHRPDFDFDEDDEDFDGDFDDQFFFTSPFLFGSFFSPFYSPFYNPFFGDAFFSDYSNAYSNPQPSSYDSEVANSSINQLSSELRDLSSEVDLLREQDDLLRSDLQRREARGPQAPSGNVSPTPSEPPVVLVFRDGHRSEVQNYAIVGQTFWMLSDKKSIKVPLSELDLDETTKANRDRGLTFSVGPGPR